MKKNDNKSIQPTVNSTAAVFYVSTKKGMQMSLTEELKAIDPEYFEKVATQLASEHDYSDYDLTTKCAVRRRKYPLYDAICRKIENSGKPLLEETMLHAMGLEHMLRTLIVIGEEIGNR